LAESHSILSSRRVITALMTMSTYGSGYLKVSYISSYSVILFIFYVALFAEGRKFVRVSSSSVDYLSSSTFFSEI
jgi:hypothetical protein